MTTNIPGGTATDPRITTHGTASSFRRGCRCYPCSEAKAREMRFYRHKAALRSDDLDDDGIPRGIRSVEDFIAGRAAAFHGHARLHDASPDYHAGFDQGREERATLLELQAQKQREGVREAETKRGTAWQNLLRSR